MKASLQHSYSNIVMKIIWSLSHNNVIHTQRMFHYGFWTAKQLKEKSSHGYMTPLRVIFILISSPCHNRQYEANKRSINSSILIFTFVQQLLEMASICTGPQQLSVGKKSANVQTFKVHALLQIHVRWLFGK
jgi:Gpi18-like mannosyltransferase